MNEFSRVYQCSEEMELNKFILNWFFDDDLKDLTILCFKNSNQTQKMNEYLKKKKKEKSTDLNQNKKYGVRFQSRVNDS